MDLEQYTSQGAEVEVPTRRERGDDKADLKGITTCVDGEEEQSAQVR